MILSEQHFQNHNNAGHKRSNFSPDVLVEPDPPVELDERKVVVELRGPVEPVVPDDLLDAVLGLLPPARPPRPVVLAQDHLDVAHALLQHAVRRRQHVPVMS